MNFCQFYASVSLLHPAMREKKLATFTPTELKELLELSFEAGLGHAKEIKQNPQALQERSKPEKYFGRN